MNQVTEMLRLAEGALERDAIARLSVLFEMMDREPGFREAEVLRRTDEPGVLLVLHAWESIEDWQTFQNSEPKAAFAASRPASLYSFLPCGMSWQLRGGDATPDAGRFLRREVLRGPVEPLAGEGVQASATFSYLDYNPELQEASMRLTRLTAAPGLRDLACPSVISDEVYESVYTHSRSAAQATAPS
jgi:heme-degrading monooxygenase HmoA